MIHVSIIFEYLVHVHVKTVGPLVLAWINCVLTRAATRKSFIVFGKGGKVTIIMMIFHMKKEYFLLASPRMLRIGL